MRKLSVLLTSFILILIASNMIVVSTISAQTIPNPSAPEFTLKIIDNSFTAPATVTIDPFTGANLTEPSHRVDNKTIEVVIKNQPFSPTLIQEGNSNWTTAFYYNVHFKGHYSEDLIPVYFYGDPFPALSNSNYTTIEYPLKLTSPNASSYYLQVYREDTSDYSSIPTEIPASAQIDLEVQAMIGNFHRGYNASVTDQLQMYPWVFEGQTSDWNTQTLKIPETSNSASPLSSIPELSPTAILPMLILVLGAFALLKLDNRASKNHQELPEHAEYQLTQEMADDYYGNCNSKMHNYFSRDAGFGLNADHVA